MASLIVFIPLAAASALACGDSGSEPAVVGSVTVTYSATHVCVGQTVEATATPLTVQAVPITGRTITWQSSNPDIASVSGSGSTVTVRLVGSGSAAISATAGEVTGTGPQLSTVADACVRFINVIPDTGAIDFRFTEAIDWFPSSLGMVFRGATSYQPVTAGARHLRVIDPRTQAILADEVLNLSAGGSYTMAIAGYTRSGIGPLQRLYVTEDFVPTVAPPKIALRFLHLGVDLPAVDGFITPPGSTTSTSAAFSLVPFGAVTPYMMRDAGAATLQLTNAGSTMPALATGTLPPMAAQGGLVLTAVLVPRSVAGSLAPQNFTSPGVIFLVDRSPP